MKWFSPEKFPTSEEFGFNQNEVIARLIDPFLLPHQAAVDVAHSVEQRRVSINQLMWQVPALALAAQAFLLTVVLGADTSPPARAVAAGTAAILMGLTWHLFRRHRILEVGYSRWLERFEERNGLPPIHRHDVLAGGAPARDEQSQVGPALAFLRSSAAIWRAALLALTFAYIALLVIMLIDPGLFDGG